LKHGKYRLLFMGTPEFSVPSLVGLAESEDLTLAVTNPDRPKGRGRSVEPPPVKVAALDRGIPVFQPERVKNNPDAVSRIREEEPDIIVVVAYGKILPPEILEIPRYGCINVHASILPKYRGAAPINWAIINGETQTGITIMKMDEGMDTGPILLVREEQIRDDDTAQSLGERLSRLGAAAIVEALTLLRAGKLEETPQDNDEATYAPMIKKDLGEIDWKEPAERIRNLVRGLHPWPSAYTIYGGKSLKIIACDVEKPPVPMGKVPGEIGEVRRDGMLVRCGEGSLLLTRLKPEGKKELDAWSFVQGYRVAEGQCLGT
jgi:methionyl-tRNA formyltransferase